MHHHCKTATACAAWAIIAASAVTASAQGLKTSDQIVDFAESKMKGYKTWAADYSQSMGMFGNRVEVNGSVTQKPPHRVWMQLDMVTMGQHRQMTVILGADGVMWQVMKMGPQQQILKMDMTKLASDVLARAGLQGSPLDQFDPAKQLENTKAVCDFHVAAARELNGQPMYVLEGRFNEAAQTNQQMAAIAATVGRTCVYIGQTDGFVHRLEQYDKSQTNLVMSMEFKNLKFNQAVPDSTFVYQPPPNAPVTDLTPMMTAPPPPPVGGR
jgi:outer membrane lipoprotein-sorting protein